MPDETPEWPGRVWLKLTRTPFTVEDPIADFVRGERRKRMRGEGDALDGHMLLTRLKVAALLAALHGAEPRVTERWWALAGYVMDASLRTREGCQRALRRADEDARRARGAGDVLRAEGAREAVARKAMRYARKVAEYVHAGSHTNATHGAEDGCSERCFTQAVRTPLVTKDEAVGLAESLGWVEQGEDKRWYPGPSKPAAGGAS